MNDRRPELFAMLAMTAIALVLSGIGPHDRITWLLEIAPVLVGIPILFWTYRRFPLTPLAYRLIFVHALILILGGHYTYARVPLGEWAQDALNLARNPYDRVGHFAQGFIPAIVAREVYLRTSPLRPSKWLVFIVVCTCMAISVTYEFIEWWAAVIGGGAADEFLGTQGDVWDTQWDMFLATIGALTSLALLSRIHDRQLAKVPKR